MLGIVLTVFILAIGLTVFFSWRLACQPPEWWKPVDPADPRVDQAARSVENGLTEQLHRVRPVTPTPPAADPSAAPPAAQPDTWTIVIKEGDANAWLAARLSEWLLNRTERMTWPSNASVPQVSFEAGTVNLGFAVTDRGAERVISAALVPSIDQNGALWLRLETLSIGRLPLPGDMVAEAGGAMIESRLPDEMKNNPDTRNFIQALSGSAALTPEAVVKLSDNRKVQLVRITPRADEIEVECRTLPR